MDKEQLAIMRLRDAAQMSEMLYGLPLIVTTSGGKDSSVCVELAQRAGIPFEVMHSHTTADAPETVYFIKEEFQRLEEQGIHCITNYPVYKGKRTSMWKLIPLKLMPPTRAARYCCDVLKERSGAGRFITTGVRWAESLNRSSRGIYEQLHRDKTKRITLVNDNDDRRLLFESCAVHAKRVCNPIIDWTDQEVWDFLISEKIPLNPLYQCGWTRVGCIGCPMAGKSRQMEFAKYPRLKKNYILAFERMLQERKRNAKKTTLWETGEGVFHWWMEDGFISGQITFDELADMENGL